MNLISARVVCDSVPRWPDTKGKKHRITTMELTYPRFIHSELMTHRKFSRNAASSRAIPVKRMLKQVWSDPALPVWWGKNQPGMQAQEELTGWRLKAAQKLWVLSGCLMVVAAYLFEKIGLHKQVSNRILEPWMWMKTIVTSTEWGHFFKLRRSPEAQPEIKKLADAMYSALAGHNPRELWTGQWHLPYVTAQEKIDSPKWVGPNESGEEYCRKLSAARCARVSYLNHDGTKPDLKKDLELHDKLITAPHASPFEHQATPFPGQHANFDGWQQYRAYIPNEYQPGSV
jgi:hypothetical protein